jgi:tetratricopeptide (TPR) repeat protein
MISVVRVFRLATRFAAWVTPHVKEWHRKRHENRVEGERHLESGNYAEAERHLIVAIAEAEQRRYSIVKRNALRLHLAEAQRRQGKLEEAERSARLAMEDAGADSGLRGMALDALAAGQLQRGDLAGAEKSIEDSICLPADAATMARRSHLLAQVRYRAGRATEAVPAFERAIALHEQAFGADHLETGHRLSELGAIHRARGNHAEAQRHLRRALKIHETHCGADSHEVTEDLGTLASSLEESGDLDGAAAQYERALKLKERVVGGNLEQLAEMQVKVARLYLHWHRYGPARELVTQAISRLERKPGRALATGLETLAQLEEVSGRTREAELLRNRALAVAAGSAI